MGKQLKNKVSWKLERFLEMEKTKENNIKIEKMVGNTQANLLEVIPKLEKLKAQIKQVKGSITYSQSGNYLKLVQTQKATAKEALAFYQAVRKWEEDNKIELYYYPLMNSFYVK